MQDVLALTSKSVGVGLGSYSVANVDAIVFQQQALTQHNYYRSLQCAPALMLNETLNTIAQSWSSHLATTHTSAHSGNTMNGEYIGENLRDTSASVAINPSNINGSSPSNAWYDEISSYNWSNPGYTSTTGHFTQLVWAGTQVMGIGLACISDGTTCYVTANYYPGGNINTAAYFAANVKQSPC
ncbi:unnamed protein product [Didymodactylos carnosus]|uniref:Golgi-associated plant pathogenesis-related protein 1 n=1 Tax=Didymodactylos carnosus TaxID=1234261 RepID=A0A814AIT6_9BILA|nr:unnamed protein product [Didymodactylos carnosus]CAF3695237.1 unnamed protein product [Didymodactylos carnosus]